MPRQLAERREQRVFEQQAGGPAVPVEHDLAAGDMRIRRKAEALQADGVDVAHVYGNMHHQHRTVRADRVEIMAIHMPVVRDAGIVETVPDDPFPAAGRRPVAQGPLHAGDGAEGRAAIHLIQTIAVRRQMAVRVDESRIEGPAAEVHHVVFPGPGVPEHVLPAADALDASVRNADGLGLGKRIGHGCDVGPDIDGLFPYQHVKLLLGCASYGGDRNAVAGQIPKKPAHGSNVHFELLCFSERIVFEDKTSRFGFFQQWNKPIMASRKTRFVLLGKIRQRRRALLAKYGQKITPKGHFER